MSQYSLRERTDVNGIYHIILDQDGYNQPIVHWAAECKAKKTKKVEKLRQEGIRRRDLLIEKDKPQYQYKEINAAAPQSSGEETV